MGNRISSVKRAYFSYSQSQWKNGIPMPPLLNAKEKSNWDAAPTDQKIKQVLDSIKDRLPQEELEKVVKNCWVHSETCDSGAKIIEVREKCLELSKTLENQEAKEFAIVCDDGVVSIPEYYKQALAKDSSVFHNIFYGSMQGPRKPNVLFKVQEVEKADLTRIIQIWLGKPLKDQQEAFNLIEICNRLDLMPQTIMNSICEAINTWPEDDNQSIATACAFAAQVQVMGGMKKVEDALIEYLLKAYIITVSKDHQETEALAILDSLSILPVTELKLDECALNNRQLQNLLTVCPHIRTLSIKDSKISDETAKYIGKLSLLEHLDVQYSRALTDLAAIEFAKLQNLISLNVEGCKRMTDQAAAEFAKLQNLTNLNVAECWFMSDQAAAEFAKLQNLTSSW